MNCFIHETPAVGLCKACHKAVCQECVVDTGNGVACSTECEKEIAEVSEVMAKNKQIYGVGVENSRFLPTGIMMYLFFSLVFLGMGIFQYVQIGKVDYFLFLMGSGFLVFTLIAWRRTRKLNLNC